jgi:hypothetical protein
MTPDQKKACEKIKPAYDTFKRAGIIEPQWLPEIKEVAKMFSIPVSESCQSCAPDLLIRIFRHHYQPYMNGKPSKAK